MARIGRVVTDPRTGPYCVITLDSGDELIVSHETRGGARSRLVIEHSKLFGFSSDVIFACDLETPAGRTALAELTRDARADSFDVTPLGALVRYVRDCPTAADVKARCAALPTARSA